MKLNHAMTRQHMASFWVRVCAKGTSTCDSFLQGYYYYSQHPRFTRHKQQPPQLRANPNPRPRLKLVL